MIRNDKELVRETKKYFGKDRSLLKKTVKAYIYDGKQYKNWKVFFQKFEKRKLAISHWMFTDFSSQLTKKEYRKLDWNWIGDLSWDIEIVLNNEVDSLYDFDFKLAKKCKNNTIRNLNIYISDIVPAFVICTYFKKCKDNIWEIGPLKLNKAEDNLLVSIKHALEKIGYYFVKQKTALRKFKELKSDLNNEGHASIFDCLFNDLDNYQLDYIRGLDNNVRDSSGKETSWKEFYDSKRRMVKREDYRWFKSRDVETVTSDSRGFIIKVEVRSFSRIPTYFELDVEEKIKKYKLKNTKK